MEGVRRLGREGNCHVSLVPKIKIILVCLRTKTSDEGSENPVMKFQLPLNAGDAIAIWHSS